MRGTVFGGAVVTVFAVAWVAGSKSLQRAYNDCIARGEEVRSALLRYTKTASGYKLRFGDWLVSQEATEAEGFMSHK